MGATPNAKVFWTTGLVFAAFAAASVASAQILPLNPSRYRIIPAPQFSSGWAGSATGFAWVDNERLLFLANDQQLSQTEQRGNRRIVKKGVPTIHLWDFRAGSITRYRDEPLADYLCAIDGKVYYGLKRDGRTVTLEGPFGEERERPGTPPRFDQGGRRLERGFNRFGCKEYWYAEVPRPRGGIATLLRAEHGILERTGSTPANVRAGGAMEPFKWWHNLGEQSTEIPFPQEWIVGPATYSTLGSGYLFTRQMGRIEPGAVNRLYLWMPRSGGVRTLDISGSENWSALYLPRITRAGLAAKSAEVKRGRQGDYDLGPQGVYLFGGGAVDEFITGRAADHNETRPLYVEQIVSGLVVEMSEVSPDGCKVALVVDPWDRPHRRFRFEAIDFCNKAD